MIDNNVESGGQVLKAYRKRKKVYGVGEYAPGRFVSVENGCHTLEYRRWRGMLQRCYGDTASAYESADVCSEWLVFQNFAQWLNDMGCTKASRLDKDILKQGNTRYCKEYCCLVPVRINSLITTEHTDKGNLPVGVTQHRNGDFSARCTDGDGIRHRLGNYSTPELAHEVYRAFKKAAVRAIADDYEASGEISSIIAEGLRKWEPAYGY